MESPKSRPGSIVINALHIYMTLILVCTGPDNLRQELFTFTVTMKKAILTAFFIVNDKVKCDLGLVGPLGVCNQE